MRNRSVRDGRSPRHHIHYGHHHMGEGETSVAEKEKTGRHAWVSHLLDAAVPRAAVAFDRLTSRQWRTKKKRNVIGVFLEEALTCADW